MQTYSLFLLFTKKRIENIGIIMSEINQYLSWFDHVSCIGYVGFSQQRPEEPGDSDDGSELQSLLLLGDIDFLPSILRVAEFQFRVLVCSNSWPWGSWVWYHTSFCSNNGCCKSSKADQGKHFDSISCWHSFCGTDGGRGLKRDIWKCRDNCDI